MTSSFQLRERDQAEKTGVCGSCSQTLTRRVLGRECPPFLAVRERCSAASFPWVSFQRKSSSFLGSGSELKYFIQRLTWSCLFETLTISWWDTNTHEVHSLTQSVLTDKKEHFRLLRGFHRELGGLNLTVEWIVWIVIQMWHQVLGQSLKGLGSYMWI